MNTIAYRALGGKFQNNWQSSGNQWLNPKVFVLESSRIRAGRFVLESGHKSSGRLAIRAWRFVAESEHVGGGILGHSWQNLKWLNPIRAWIRICSLSRWDGRLVNGCILLNGGNMVGLLANDVFFKKVLIMVHHGLFNGNFIGGSNYR